MVNGQCLATMMTSGWGSPGQNVGLGGFVMANSKSDDLQHLQLWLSVGISSLALVLVSRDRDPCHVQPHPNLIWTSCGGCRSWPVLSNLHNGHLPEGWCHGQGSPSPAFISLYATMAWYPAETNMCNFVTQQPEEVHDMANKRVLSVFTFNRLQAGYSVRVDYYIVVDWAHVLVIVQCQCDGCSLSSKDGAVVWQSFGQVAAGLDWICLTMTQVLQDILAILHK